MDLGISFSTSVLHQKGVGRGVGHRPWGRKELEGQAGVTTEQQKVDGRLARQEESDQGRILSVTWKILGLIPRTKGIGCGAGSK